MNRTLVCVICQTRSWELTWPKFKKNVLEALQADLALCISVPDNYNYLNPFWQHAKHKIVFPEYDDWGDALDYIQEVELNFDTSNRPDWRQLHGVTHENWLGGVKRDGETLPGSGGIIFTARWYLLRYIESEKLFDKYDRLIVTRSDFLHNVVHPNVTIFDPNYIWVPDGEGYGGITDRHVILSKHNYKQYLNLFANIVLRPDDYFYKMINYSWNCERFLKLNILEQRRSIKFYPYHMYTVRQSNDQTTWAKGSYHSEHGHYIKYDHEYSAAIEIEKHIKKQTDWVDIVKNNNAMNCFNAYVTTEDGTLITYEEEKDIYRLAEPNEELTFALVLDCKNGEGELFLSSIHMGLFERMPLQRVRVQETSPGYFTMQTVEHNEILFVYNNILAKATELGGPSVFKLKNRYHLVMNQ